MYASSFIGRRSASMTTAQNLSGLSLDDIRRTAPSVFAEHPHESRSQRYAFIPTSSVLERLMSEGFRCTKVQQARTRIEGKQGYTKHLMTFTHPSTRGDNESGASLALLNSHDGGSRYKLLAGRIRYACLNGLLCASETYGELAVGHTGDVIGRVIEGSYSVIEQAEKAGGQVEQWRGITLQPDEQREFAHAAALLRWDGVEEKAPVVPERLLQVRRNEDRGNDLWRTFNVLQENLVRGGQAGHLRTANGARRSVRAVNGIDGNVQLNRALWSLTERMAALKAAA